MALEVGDHGLDRRLVHAGRVGKPGVFEAQFGEPVDLSRHSLRGRMDSVGGRFRENARPFVARRSQSVLQVLHHVPRAERSQVVAQCDALIDRPIIRHLGPKLGLANQNQSERRAPIAILLLIKSSL